MARKSKKERKVSENTAAEAAAPVAETVTEQTVASTEVAPVVPTATEAATKAPKAPKQPRVSKLFEKRTSSRDRYSAQFGVVGGTKAAFRHALQDLNRKQNFATSCCRGKSADEAVAFCQSSRKPGDWGYATCGGDQSDASIAREGGISVSVGLLSGVDSGKTADAALNLVVGALEYRGLKAAIKDDKVFVSLYKPETVAETPTATEPAAG